MSGFRILTLALLVPLASAAPALAAGASAALKAISAEGIGADVGTAEFTEGKDGLSITLSIKGIPDGEHGMHIHEKGDCAAAEKDGKKTAGLAAGPHYDPEKSGKHAGPQGQGHKGDLPKIEVKGETKTTVTVPRLKLADVTGRALIIHEGGDTYSDNPELGGGKARIACGVIQGK